MFQPHEEVGISLARGPFGERSLPNKKRAGCSRSLEDTGGPPVPPFWRSALGNSERWEDAGVDRAFGTTGWGGDGERSTSGFGAAERATGGIDDLRGDEDD